MHPTSMTFDRLPHTSLPIFLQRPAARRGQRCGRSARRLRLVEPEINSLLERSRRHERHNVGR
jgi:hypothetical protein